MKIGIDARMYGYSGIGTYVRGLLDHMPDEGKGSITLFGSRARLSAYSYPVVSSHAPVYGIQEQIVLPGLYKKHPVDVLHVPHYNIPLLYRKKMIVTIHDLNHLLFPQFLPNRCALYYAKALFNRAVKKARIIIADSHNTKKDILQYFKAAEGKIRVIYLGIDGIYFKKLDQVRIESVRFHYNLPKKYILYVGNIRLSKNIPLLLQAYRKLDTRIKEEYPLVLIGRNFLAPAYWRMHNEENIIVKEDVPREDLPALYQGACLFVFPSLYEGFGLPPLEAMASGIPVLSSNAGSLPEVLRDAAVMVHSNDCDGLSDAMAGLLHTASMRNEMIQKGYACAARFTWEQTARAHWSLYQEFI